MPTGATTAGTQQPAPQPPTADDIAHSMLILRNPDGVLVLDRAGAILYVNPAAEALFGRPAETLVGREFGFPIVLGEAAEVDLLTRQGTSVAEIRVVEIDWQGQHAYLAMLRDVTDRKRLAVALRASAERLHFAMEATNDGLWDWDILTGEVVASERWFELFGYRPGEIAATIRVWEDTLHPDDVAETQASLVAYLEGRAPAYRSEHRVITKSGEVRWHLSVGKVVAWDAGGRPVRMVGTNADITDRKRLEHLLQQTNANLERQVAARTAELTESIAELERANAGKDAFMAAVSHELRTPLVGILSMSEVLQSQARGPLNPDQERYVEMVRESGERLLATVNGVLLYTGLMTGAVHLQREPCRLSDLCASSIRAVRARAMRKGQNITLDVAPKNLEIYSDVDGITNLVTMLLDNAVKFTPNSGQIGVRVAHDADARFVRLEVWDTGIGMTDAQLAYVFRPFAQADQGLTRQFAGMGIGLAYVNQVVNLLGGTVTVESVPDQGSRFIVRLPAQVEEIGT